MQPICIYPNKKPYNVYLKVIYTLTYILKICNTSQIRLCTQKDLCLLSRGSRTGVLPHSLSAILMSYCHCTWLLCSSHTEEMNEYEEAACRKRSVLDYPSMLVLLCGNTSGLTGVSVDLVQVKGRISPTMCLAPTEPIYLSNMDLTFLTNLLNACPKAKQSNWRFQIQSECNVM